MPAGFGSTIAAPGLRRWSAAPTSTAARSPCRPSPGAPCAPPTPAVNWRDSVSPRAPIPTPTCPAASSSLRAAGCAAGRRLPLRVPGMEGGGVGATPAGTLELPAAFFAGGPFGAYNLSTVIGGIAIAPGTTLALEQQNLQPNAALLALPTGGKPAAVAALGYLSPAIRSPVNLSLTASLPGVPFDPYDPAVRLPPVVA